MKPTKRIPRMSAKQLEESKEYAWRKKEFLESHEHCERCKKPIPFSARDLHHWAKRAGKLYLENRLWLCLCRRCHEWVHRHEQIAQRDGWIAPQGCINDYPKALIAWGQRDATMKEKFQLERMQIYLMAQIASEP